MKRKKRSVNEKAADWMSQVIRWLAFICLALVFVLNLFYTSSVGDGEKVTIAGSSWQWIPMAVVLAAVLIFWNGLSDRISEKKLFAGMAVFYIIVGFYFILISIRQSGMTQSRSMTQLPRWQTVITAV